MSKPSNMETSTEDKKFNRAKMDSRPVSVKIEIEDLAEEDKFRKLENNILSNDVTENSNKFQKSSINNDILVKLMEAPVRNFIIQEGIVSEECDNAAKRIVLSNSIDKEDITDASLEVYNKINIHEIAPNLEQQPLYDSDPEMQMVIDEEALEFFNIKSTNDVMTSKLDDDPESKKVDEEVRTIQFVNFEKNTNYYTVFDNYRCDICALDWNLRERFETHIRNLHIGRNLKIKLIKGKYNSTYIAFKEEDVANVINNKPDEVNARTNDTIFYNVSWFCHKCLIPFNSKSEEDAHEIMEIFTCQECNIEFSHCYKLLDHYFSNTCRAMLCKLNCRQKFVSAEIRDWHSKLERCKASTSSVSFCVCHLCNLGCRNNFFLYHHYLRNHVECANLLHLSFVLENKGMYKTFSSRPGKPIFVCPNCSKQFDDSDSLELHRRQNEDGDVWICPICAEDVVGLCERNRHNCAVHKIQQGPTCSVCNSLFASKKALKIHVMTEHILGTAPSVKSEEDSMNKPRESTRQPTTQNLKHETDGHIDVMLENGGQVASMITGTTTRNVRRAIRGVLHGVPLLEIIKHTGISFQALHEHIVELRKQEYESARSHVLSETGEKAIAFTFAVHCSLNDAQPTEKNLYSYMATYMQYYSSISNWTRLFYRCFNWIQLYYFSYQQYVANQTATHEQHPKTESLRIRQRMMGAGYGHGTDASGKVCVNQKDKHMPLNLKKPVKKQSRKQVTAPSWAYKRTVFPSMVTGEQRPAGNLAALDTSPSPSSAVGAVEEWTGDASSSPVDDADIVIVKHEIMDEPQEYDTEVLEVLNNLRSDQPVHLIEASEIKEEELENIDDFIANTEEISLDFEELEPRLPTPPEIKPSKPSPKISPSEINKSLPTKSDKYRFHCAACDMGSNVLSKYLLHLIRHGYAKHTCPACGATHHQTSVFVKHVLIHVHLNYNIGNAKTTTLKILLQMKPSECLICNKTVEAKYFIKHWESHVITEAIEPAELPAKLETKDLKIEIAPSKKLRMLTQPIVKQIVQKDGMAYEVKKITENDIGVATTAKHKNGGCNYMSNINRSENLLLDDTMLNQIKHVLLSLKKDVERVCSVCRKDFHRSSEFKRHLIEHLVWHTIKSEGFKGIFKCIFCSEETGGNVLVYKRHLRTHSNLALYLCTICDKTFSDSSNYAKHKKVHGMQCMKCDTCGRRFNSIAMIEKHMEYHEQTQPLPCPHCDRVFYFRSALLKHCNTQHAKKSDLIKCNYCKFTCSSTKIKWDHQWAVHRIRRFKADCTYCEEGFRTFRHLHHHAKTVHNMPVRNMFKRASIPPPLIHPSTDIVEDRDGNSHQITLLRRTGPDQK